MSKFLLDKNYTVFGFTRSLKKNNLKNLKILGIKKHINLKKYKEDDDFDPKNMDGKDWDNYIRNNMVFVEDI